MPTIKYDVSDVESGGGGEHAQPGMYAGKIVSVVHRTQKSDGTPANDLEVIVDIGPEYRRLWTYIGLEKNTAWKLKEFTDATGLPAKGSLTPAAQKKLEGTKVNVKVAADTDLSGDYRGRVKNLFKPGEGGGPSADAEASEDYNEWELDELIAELETREIEVPKGRKTVAKLAALLEEDDESEPEEEEDEDADEEEDEDAPEDEYDEWDIKDLKEEVESRDATGNLPTGRKTKQMYIELLRELDAGGESGDDDEDVPPIDEYDEWEEQDLKDEIASRNEQGAEIKIKGRPTVAKLIDALREDDANAEPF